MKRSKSPGAGVGEVLLAPLENRKFGLAWVLRTHGPHAGIVMSSHLGGRLSFDQAVAVLRPWLQEASMSPGGRLDGPPVAATRWVSSPLPPDWSVLGVLAPGTADAQLAISAYSGGWANVSATILIGWLRANDPRGAERLAAKWRRETERLQRQHRKAGEARAEALTLEKLARGSPPPLPAWPKRHPAQIVRAARASLRRVAREVLAATDAREKTAALRRGVERFNALDGRHGFEILTTEREDLCAAFLDIARAAKMKTPADPTERWRDW